MNDRTLKTSKILKIIKNYIEFKYRLSNMIIEIEKKDIWRYHGTIYIDNNEHEVVLNFHTQDIFYRKYLSYTIAPTNEYLINKMWHQIISDPIRHEELKLMELI